MQKKDKFLLILFFSIFTNCSDSKISILDWNASIYNHLNKSNVFLIENLKVKKEIDFVLNSRVVFFEEFNKIISDYKNDDIIFYENYDCGFNKNDDFETDIPFSKNKFYYEITIAIKGENKFYYYARCYSEFKDLEFEKVEYESNDEYLNAINPQENEAQKKDNYLLNNLSIISFINNSKIDKVFVNIN